MSLEFGPKIKEQFRKILERVKSDVSASGKSLEKMECGKGCKVRYVDIENKVQGKDVILIHYAVTSERHSFIISYGSGQSKEKAKEFVLDISDQILKNGI